MDLFDSSFEDAAPLSPHLKISRQIKGQSVGRGRVDQPFVFLDTFFESLAADWLIENWPSINRFVPSLDSSKTYDRMGIFDLKNGTRKDLGRYSRYAQSLVECLTDEDWLQFLKSLRSTEYALCLVNLSLAEARTGSYLLPHKDSVGVLGDGSWLNLVIMLESVGTDDARRGLTSFYQTNDFESLVFRPPATRNCAILYDTSHDLYHGFPPLHFRASSRRIVAQYATSIEANM